MGKPGLTLKLKISKMSVFVFNVFDIHIHYELTDIYLPTTIGQGGSLFIHPCNTANIYWVCNMGQTLDQELQGSTKHVMGVSALTGLTV